MSTVGIIGGGQLGMMLAKEIHNLGAKAICLDPNPNCPASYVCEDVVVSEYSSIEGLKKLGDSCDVLTYEFENVPADALKYLLDTYNIPQGIKPLFDSQNRIREKSNAKAHGLNTPMFEPVSSLSDLLCAIERIGYPCVYKTTTLGYDGHGQVVLRSEADIKKVEPYLEGEGILEEFIKYDFETSIIMVRSKNEIISFPLTKNIHKDGILDLVIADEKFIEEHKEVFEKIKNASYKFMESANYYGILTIEYFVKGNDYYFNEMAPRPHNSGHYTIEGCTTNQYRELARMLLGLPLTNPELKYPTIMKNILGFDYENMKKVTITSDVHIHDYKKKDVKEKRKMAHITFTNINKDMYDKKYRQLFLGGKDE